MKFITLFLLIGSSILTGCSSSYTGSQPSQISPLDECHQAMQNGDTLAIAEKCDEISRDK
ncbi:hypothetical protein ELZ88_24365 (plasmid) [Salmonella enterica subsp. enterica serovar Karamoja]|uniref:Lipoprotein n=1 Tax=Salmonella enterica subsp. enterica serovar Karamoja TaxID=2500153 RepID=A0A3Q9N062_SALET|nr:hypothetical protein ELZ88_24365 [Salmonella enterica subsp. enterica serovar Karamoja]AZT44432.1 hypothetical protein EL007_24575 [Salmonella enterica subsp. enterica serovar Karamoja]